MSGVNNDCLPQNEVNTGTASSRRSMRGRGSPRHGGGSRRGTGQRSTSSSHTNSDRPPSELAHVMWLAG